MTQECWNKHKINILCKLGNQLYEVANKAQYSVEICDDSKMLLAAMMYETICPVVFDASGEYHCLTTENAESILSYIYSLLNKCNC